MLLHLATAATLTMAPAVAGMPIAPATPRPASAFTTTALAVATTASAITETDTCPTPLPTTVAPLCLNSAPTPSLQAEPSNTVEVQAIPDESSSAHLTVTIASAATPDAAFTLTGIPQVSARVQPEGALQVLEADGTWLASTGKPAAIDSAGGIVPVTASADGSRVTYHLESTPSTQFPVSLTAVWGSKFTEKVVWDEASNDPFAPILRVSPTALARQGNSFDREPAWNETKNLAGPRADRNNMKDQYLCHFDFASRLMPDKETWNLELGRPDVGYLATVLAACNPR